MGERYINPAYPLFSNQNEIKYNFVSDSSNESPLPKEATPKSVYKEHFSKKKK